MDCIDLLKKKLTLFFVPAHFGFLSRSKVKALPEEWEAKDHVTYLKIYSEAGKKPPVSKTRLDLWPAAAVTLPQSEYQNAVQFTELSKVGKVGVSLREQPVPDKELERFMAQYPQY